MGSSLTFKKEERLCSKILIEKLFVEGTSVYFPPLRFTFLKIQSLNTIYPAQVVFSVPKRLHSGAVNRNLLKRRMREAYRAEKIGFYDQLFADENKMIMMIIYIDKEIKLFPEIKNAMNKGLIKAIKKLNKINQV
jgi:ribonuclease P protein component